MAKEVILDKNFIQGENKNVRRLRLLHDAGATFVLTDTLLYELCSDTRTNQWATAQRKLSPFADSLEIWFHVDDLISIEVATRTPLISPIDREITNIVREWFGSGSIYVPPNIVKLAEQEKDIRELHNSSALIGEARMLFSDGMPSDAEAIEKIVHAYFGKPDGYHYLEHANDILNEEWFAYRYARALLVFYKLVDRKYGKNLTAGKAFPNTKLDLDYAVLLHYAEALATNETKGDMHELCLQCHGIGKATFTLADVDRVAPLENEIQKAAFHIWESAGKTHGHDFQDWLKAKDMLLVKFWRELTDLKNNGQARIIK